MFVGQIQALIRAEQFVMNQDEIELKNKIKRDLEYFSSRKIQTIYRRVKCQRKYKKMCRERQIAASKIQNAYLERLYYRAIKLPVWCVLGREVIVAQSIARKAGRKE